MGPAAAREEAIGGASGRWQTATPRRSHKMVVPARRQPDGGIGEAAVVEPFTGRPTQGFETTTSPPEAKRKRQQQFRRYVVGGGLPE